MDLLDALLPSLEGRAPGAGAGAGLQDELLLLVQAPLLSCQAVQGCWLALARRLACEPTSCSILNRLWLAAETTLTSSDASLWLQVLGALAAQEGQAPRTRCSIAAFLRDRLAQLASAGALQLHWQAVQVPGNGHAPCIEGASAAALAICPCVSSFILTPAPYETAQTSEEKMYKQASSLRHNINQVQLRSRVSPQTSTSARFLVFCPDPVFYQCSILLGRRSQRSGVGGVLRPAAAGGVPPGPAPACPAGQAGGRGRGSAARRARRHTGNARRRGRGGGPAGGCAAGGRRRCASPCALGRLQLCCLSLGDRTLQPLRWPESGPGIVACVAWMPQTSGATVSSEDSAD